MPGRTGPLEGPQAFHGLIEEIKRRVSSLETWQRTTRGIPPGTITQWGGPGVPGGALACNGATFSATQYPRLYAALGNSNVLPNITGSVIWT